MANRMGRAWFLTLAMALCALPHVAAAATYYYVDWMVADVDHGTASGTITLPDGSKVTVTFAAINADGTQGDLYGAQVNNMGTNYWMPSDPYISAQVQNAPPGTDILQLAGGKNEVYKVTLSEPIKDPIMAIVSLGQAGLPTTYNFDSPFTIVSQGAGFWGGSSTALVQLPNNVLQGSEGHGTIQFLGVFSTFSWTVPTPESWHGFTFGIRTTERLEPDMATPPVMDLATQSRADAASVIVDMAVAPVIDASVTPPDMSVAPPDESVAPPDATVVAAPDFAVSGGGSTPSGCGCAIAGRHETGSLALVAGLLLLALAARRHRRSARATRIS